MSYLEEKQKRLTNQPGQLLKPHRRVWLLRPGQFAPPLPGGGLVQVLLLVCDPIPQVLEHRLQARHRDQPPLTVETVELGINTQVF